LTIADGRLLKADSRLLMARQDENALLMRWKIPACANCGGSRMCFSRSETERQKDVRNEECSSEFVENKGAKKVLLRS
jgi:ribosomal protein S27E